MKHRHLQSSSETETEFRHHLDNPSIRPVRTELIGIAAAVWLLWGGTSASADTVDREGVGASIGAMAGVSLLSTDPAAVFHDPTSVLRSAGRFSLNVRVPVASAAIRLKERPDGVDVGEAAIGSQPIDGWPMAGQRAIPTSALHQRRNTTDVPDGVNMTMATSVRVGSRFAVGLGLDLPVDTMQALQSRYVDERAQYFDNRLHFFDLGAPNRGIAAVLGLGWRPIPSLQVGAGVRLQQSVTSRADVFLSQATGGDPAPANVQTRVDVSVRPSAAIAWQPSERSSFLLAWHAPGSMPVQSRSVVRIRGLDGAMGEQVLNPTFLLDQSPMRIAFQGAYRGDNWSVGAAAVWRRWSTLRSEHDEPIAGGLDDGVEFRLAGSVRLSDALRWLAGLTYRPSPVPEQTGRTNIVDNDRIGGATGVAWTVALGESHLELNVGARAVRLLTRSHRKYADASDPVFDEWPDSLDPVSGDPIPASHGMQTNNPGFPGFSSAGWVGAVWLGITFTPGA